MAFISLTRLRVRSIQYLPPFAVHTSRSLRQVKKAPGFQAGKLLIDRSRTFWTITSWSNQESMRSFMTAGAHKAAMPYLLQWCDEASVAHWEQDETPLPSWEEAHRRMRETGRASKVNNPSPDHAALNFREPRTSVGGPI